VIWKTDSGGGGGGGETLVFVMIASLILGNSGWRERTYMEDAGPEKPNVYFVVAFPLSIAARHPIHLHLLEILQGDHLELSGLADTMSLVVVRQNGVLRI
jgi:hypothetical protein